MKPIPLPSKPQRVLIIKPSSLGDVVHSLPILPELRRLWPQAHLSWVVSASFRSLLEGRPDLDRVIPYDKGPSGVSWRGLKGLARLASTLARERFDLTIDLQGLLRSGLMTAATRAPIRVGMADAREGAGRFYTHTIDAPRASVHAVDRVMVAAEALGARRATQLDASIGRKREIVRERGEIAGNSHTRALLGDEQTNAIRIHATKRARIDRKRRRPAARTARAI